MIKPKHVVKKIKGDYRIIVISDIHGHLDRLKMLLRKVRYTPDDYLVILGDFVEKGDQVIDTIHYIQYLAKNERVFVLMGNCEWALEAMLTIPEIAGELPKYLKRVSTNGSIRYVYNKLNLYDGHETMLGVQKTIANYLHNEIKFISTLPVTLKINDFLFVHAGLEYRKDYKNSSLSSLLEMQRFLEQGHLLDETVIVGHLPTSNYKNTIDNNIIIDSNKKIICIDGGTGVKPVSQLNALIIESIDNHITYKSEYVQPLPKYKVLYDFSSDQKEIHKISFPDFEVKIIEKGQSFSKCLHIATSKELYIKNEFLYKKDNKILCLDDYTDCILNVKKNDMIKLIGIYGEYIYAIKDKQVGWLKLSNIMYKS